MRDRYERIARELERLVARHQVTLAALGLLPVITEMGKLLGELVNEVEKLRN